VTWFPARRTLTACSNCTCRERGVTRVRSPSRLPLTRV
jgi:hypothetical protein